VIEVDALDLHTPPGLHSSDPAPTETALLQYTSGSTRSPAGVVVTHKNIVVNLGQMMSDHYADNGRCPPPDTTVVSWLPLYHDMGLQLGIFFPILAGLRTVMMSPMAFLQKPARWMQLLATNTRAFSGAPNFALELAARRTSDADMAGLDLGNVLTIGSGAERVHAATIRRFTERFFRFNFPDTALQPGYGMAEATVYVSSSDTARPPAIVRFDYEELSAGHAKRCDGESGTELVSNGAPRACTVRIVDPETRIENPAGEVGEVWVHGDNVAGGYWRNPQLSTHTFGAWLIHPSPGTPQGPWLRTGDLGVLSDGDLFIVGRIKDMLIVDGRNHYPDDIEATIQEITGGRVAAISVRDDHSERLVAIVEVKKPASSKEGVRETFHTVKRELVSTRHPAGRSRTGPARLDPDHHEWKGPPFGMRRAVPTRPICPSGQNMTASRCRAEPRNWLAPTRSSLEDPLSNYSRPISSARLRTAPAGFAAQPFSCDRAHEHWLRRRRPGVAWRRDISETRRPP
jgi:long-chain fatty acid adenylase/transferase FadD26